MLNRNAEVFVAFTGRYVPRAVLMDLVSSSRPVVFPLLAQVSF